MVLISGLITCGSVGQLDYYSYEKAKGRAMLNSILISTVISGSIFSGFALASDKKNAKYLIIREFIGIRDIVADQVATYNAREVQKDFDYQFEFAKSESNTKPSASGCWRINGYEYCYTAYEGGEPKVEFGGISKESIENE